MPVYEFHRESAALVIVDMQNAFVKPGYPLAIPDAPSTVPEMNRLITVCRSHNIPIVWLKTVFDEEGCVDAGLLKEIAGNKVCSLAKGEAGVDIYPELDWQADDITVLKKRFSGFHNTNLESILRERNIDTLLIVGTVLNVCCETTARDAFQRDFRVLFPIDLNSTRPHDDLGFGAFSAEDMAKAVLTSLGTRFVQLISTKDLIKEIEDWQLTICN